MRGLQDLRPLDVKFRSLRTREESKTLVPILLAYALSLCLFVLLEPALLNQFGQVVPAMATMAEIVERPRQRRAARDPRLRLWLPGVCGPGEVVRDVRAGGRRRVWLSSLHQ